MDASANLSESSALHEVPYNNSETTNSPLFAFFHEVNKIRQGQDKKRHRTSASGSPSLLSSSYNLSKKELSDIKAAAFFNRCYAGIQSADNLDDNIGICIKKNGSFSRDPHGSTDAMDDSLSIKTSLSDYKISNKNNLSKIATSPLKASTVYNEGYSAFSNRNSYVKDRNEPSVDIFKDEVSEKKCVTVENVKKENEEKDSKKKSALRSISLNIKDLISSIVSNIDDHVRQPVEQDNNVKSSYKSKDNLSPQLSKTENILKEVSSNEKNNSPNKSFSGFYDKSFIEDKSVKGIVSSKVEKNGYENLENQNKNWKNERVCFNTFQDLDDNYQITKNDHEIYSDNNSSEVFDNDVSSLGDSIYKSNHFIEDLPINKSKVESPLPSLPRLCISQTSNFGLGEFMAKDYLDASVEEADVSLKETDKSMMQTNGLKTNFLKEESFLNRKKSEAHGIEVKKKLCTVSNSVSKLPKTESGLEISQSNVQEHSIDTKLSNNNENASIVQRKVSYNTRMNANDAYTLPVLRDQFLSDFDPSLDDVSSVIDKVIGSRKRGYIMRQNTKIVHATSEDNSRTNFEKDMSEQFKLDNSHEKKEKENLQFDETSVINRHDQGISINKRKNAGLLFVRVLGIKNLELPLPENEPLRFCCTLDNNKHYVTTPWMPLSKNAKIDEEFQLTAYDDLEFTFTLRVDYEPKVIEKKNSIFSKIFKSSKKHKFVNATNSFANNLSNNGSFGRSYISLKMLKNEAYGHSYITTIPCMNEWTKRVVVKGKNRQVLKVKPYIICQLRITAFYVPFVLEQPKETLPKSLSACIRDIKNAEWVSKLSYEGLLIQHGGDCLYRKKRYFRLTGLKLISYHEFTRSIRSNINLVNAVSVLNDQQLCVNSKPFADKDKKNNYSALLESDGDYMFIEGGFCIKFMNGEVINFYAESEDEKARWVRILNVVIKKAKEVKPWSLHAVRKQRAMRRLTSKDVSNKTETCKKNK
ncbi:hypothetical protein PORY_000665 [Pneumocystis oryctolagi]|uniref:Uncharacterized protein n=1 Tax=Pneumocystis oryctolagi TaxID=42067 RepID=A0ACB7CFB3_9ASCO|nr:hypothetical protein PORY_000665 [Pneumocystis oryctolagi]